MYRPDGQARLEVVHATNDYTLVVAVVESIVSILTFPRFFVFQGMDFMLPVFAVVKYLDIFKRHRLHFIPHLKAFTIHTLILEATEPAFAWCVVPTISFTAHRSGHAEFLQLVLECMASVGHARAAVSAFEFNMNGLDHNQHLRIN
jgi:hypothetical protein